MKYWFHSDDDKENTNANMVCQELNCGKYQKTLKSITFDANGSSYKVPLTCIGNETVSWQCVDWVSAKSNTCQEEISIICSSKIVVRLWLDTIQAILHILPSTSLVKPLLTIIKNLEEPLFLSMYIHTVFLH